MVTCVAVRTGSQPELVPIIKFNFLLIYKTFVHVDFCTCRLLYIETFVHVDTWTDGHLDTWTDGHLDTWTDGQMDTWTDGHLDTWLLGNAVNCRTLNPSVGTYVGTTRMYQVLINTWKLELIPAVCTV